MRIESAFNLVTNNLNTVMVTGSYTAGFALELANFASQNYYNIHSIVDEIAALGGGCAHATGTKPAAAFRGRDLKGYWHKHFTQARFMAMNILNETMRDGTVEKFLRPHIGKTLTPELLGRLTYALVHDNFCRRGRDGRLTGEWIVFSKVARANHYITLAAHTEGDRIIARRIQRYLDTDRATGWRSDDPSVSVRFGLAADPTFPLPV